MCVRVSHTFLTSRVSMQRSMRSTVEMSMYSLHMLFIHLVQPSTVVCSRTHVNFRMLNTRLTTLSEQIKDTRDVSGAPAPSSHSPRDTALVQSEEPEHQKVHVHVPWMSSGSRTNPPMLGLPGLDLRSSSPPSCPSDTSPTSMAT